MDIQIKEVERLGGFGETVLAGRMRLNNCTYIEAVSAPIKCEEDRVMFDIILSERLVRDACAMNQLGNRVVKSVEADYAGYMEK